MSYIDLAPCTSAAEVRARAKRGALLRQESYKARPPRPVVVVQPPAPKPRPIIAAPVEIEPPPPPPPTVRAVILAAAKYFDLHVVEFLSARREHRVCRPRQIAMYVAKCVTPYSLPHIGRCFGGRDHTTILSNCRKIGALKETDPEVAKAVKDLVSLFERDAP